MASATYVAGYVQKKVRARERQRANPFTGELMAPEFARMSLRPAVGKRWIEKHWRDVYPRDFVVIDGAEAKPPRFYDKWMDGYHERGRRCMGGYLCHQHQKVMEQVRQNRCEERVEMTKYQLASGEAIALARRDLFAKRAKI